jgi:hypothetical protein
MLVGLALIAVPLLVALLTAVLQIRDLADTGTKIVIQGVAGARASQKLFGQIASLERTARRTTCSASASSSTCTARRMSS